MTELESYDELHREDDEDSLLADFEDVAGRLLRRYIKWYAQKGGDGKTPLPKPEGMTDPETKAAAAKATGAKALAAQTQSRTQTGKGSGANVLCRRCWDRGHVIKDFPAAGEGVHGVRRSRSVSRVWRRIQARQVHGDEHL